MAGYFEVFKQLSRFIEMKKLLISILAVVAFFTAGRFIFKKKWNIRYVAAHFSEKFAGYNVRLPKKGGSFVVRVESSWPEIYLEKVIKRAFPEYNVIFTESKEQKPQMIFRDYYRSGRISLLDELSSFVPYISSTNEPGDFITYRATGFPFMQFSTYIADDKAHEYMPYAAISKTNLKDELPASQSNNGNYKYARPKGIAYTYSHCHPHRDKLFYLLKEKLGDQVHALGKCPLDYKKSEAEKDAIPPRITGKGKNSEGWRQLQEAYSKYNFVFAMENTARDGYITEKIMNAYEGGAIPIYWGHSETVERFFNPHSYIDIDKFDSLEEARDYIVDIFNNKEKLESYLNTPMFKGEGLSSRFFINQPELNSEEEADIENLAIKLRNLYFETIQTRGNKG